MSVESSGEFGVWLVTMEGRGLCLDVRVFTL